MLLPTRCFILLRKGGNHLYVRVPFSGPTRKPQLLSAYFVFTSLTTAPPQCPQINHKARVPPTLPPTPVAASAETADPSSTTSSTPSSPTLVSRKWSANYRSPLLHLPVLPKILLLQAHLRCGEAPSAIILQNPLNCKIFASTTTTKTTLPSLVPAHQIWCPPSPRRGPRRGATWSLPKKLSPALKVS